MVFLVLAVGALYTLWMVVPQIRLIKDMVRYLLGGGDSQQGVSSFQAFSLALGGRVGVGNIAGVATAIHFGGPGAVFWMWLTALLGAALAVAESSLAQVYKEEINGEYRGGPAYYIEKGLRWKWLAILYAVAGIIAFGFTGPAIQANSIASSFEGAFSINPLITGLVVAALFSAVVFGGMKRIGQVSGYVVPFMAAAYILVAIVVLVVNADSVPGMFALIFRSAFGAESMFGGMMGAVIMWGVKRAIYSSEAGTGSGAQASAAAEVSHPVKQGLAQGFSVYVDTLFVCTTTALMILSTNSYNVEGPNGEKIVEYAPDLVAGPQYTQAAADTILPGFGAGFVAVALFFFAFTTLLSFGFYADTNVAYILRESRWQRPVNIAVKLVIVGMSIFGAVRTSTFAWNLADIGVGLYTWVNLIALVLLSPKAVAVFKDYTRQRKAGIDPVFDPAAVGIEAPLWNRIGERYRAEQNAPSAARRPGTPTDG